MCPMAGRGHNYELIHADGSPDRNDMKWHEVTRLFGEFVHDLSFCYRYDGDRQPIE